MTTAAIMQPTYLPWLGYLDLLDRVDVFVLLDNVQFSKQSWQQRNRIASRTGTAWLTVPVEASVRERTRLDRAVVRDVAFVDRHLGAIRTVYRRSPGWGRWWPVLDDALRTAAAPGVSLASMNEALLRRLAAELGITTPMVRAGAIVESADRAGRLVELCRAVDADAYLSPIGAARYLATDVASFTEASIGLSFQGYEHPVYDQGGAPFVSHLSVVDALMRLGDGVEALIRSGRRPTLTLAEVLARQAADHVEEGVA